MEITPDGSHMAFITNSNVTGYDSAGHTEMYRYEPEQRTRLLRLLPTGRQTPDRRNPGQSERSLHDRRRADLLFKTLDPLVPKDTNGVEDVYEYTEGRAQLITAGLGTVSESIYDGYSSTFAASGFIGVSANGVDAYFGTIDTLDDTGSQRQPVQDLRRTRRRRLPGRTDAARTAKPRTSATAPRATRRPCRPTAPARTSGAPKKQRPSEKAEEAQEEAEHKKKAKKHKQAAKSAKGKKGGSTVAERRRFGSLPSPWLSRCSARDLRRRVAPARSTGAEIISFEAFTSQFEATSTTVIPLPPVSSRQPSGHHLQLRPDDPRLIAEIGIWRELGERRDWSNCRPASTPIPTPSPVHGFTVRAQRMLAEYPGRLRAAPAVNLADSEFATQLPGRPRSTTSCPQPGQPGLTAWKAPLVGIPIFTVFSARTGGDYGLNAETRGITSYLGLKAFKQDQLGRPGFPGARR